MVMAMENLGDILKRLNATKQATNGISHGAESASPPPTTGEGERDCDVCRGRGWYTIEVAVGHPDFGQAVICHCQQQRISDGRLDRLLRYSNLGHLTRFTFDALDSDGISRDTESRRMFADAFRTAVEYAENPEGWLVLLGPNGSGKTHLAAAIANHCIQSDRVVFFMHVPDLLDHLRSTYTPNSELTYSDLYAQVVEAPLLILDGLGAHSSTPWAEEKLHQVINHRFNAQLPTVITTANELDELDAYIRSRIEARGQSHIAHTRSRHPVQASNLGRIPPDMLRRMTFETYDVRGNNPRAEQEASMKNAALATTTYAGNPNGWLTLFGETGVGKTHLAVAIANDYIRRGGSVFFAFVPELLDYLRATFMPDSRIRYDSIFDEVKNTPLLILDDLGEEHTSPWSKEKLYQIIVHRHNSRLPTVITSKEDFTQQTSPIASRIRDPFVGQIIRIDAPDYRLRGENAGGKPAVRKPAVRKPMR